MRPVRCEMMREGRNYGVVLNGKYQGQNKFEHVCDLANGYSVKTTIDYTKNYIHVNESCYQETKLARFFRKSGLEDYYYRLFKPRNVYIFPYSTDVLLIKNGKSLDLKTHLRGFGIDDVPSRIVINTNDETFQRCHSQTPDQDCKSSFDFSALHRFQTQKYKSTTGIGCDLDSF